MEVIRGDIQPILYVIHHSTCTFLTILILKIQ